MPRDTKAIVPARITYVHVAEPWAADPATQKPKYSCCVLIDKNDTAAVAKIKKSIEAAKAVARARGIKPNRIPIHDGDKERSEDPVYQGKLFFNASSSWPIHCVDRRCRPMEPALLYSGCFVNLSVNFYPYNRAGNMGIAAGLGNIQFVEDGDRLDFYVPPELEFKDLGELEVKEEEITEEDLPYTIDEEDVPWDF